MIPFPDLSRLFTADLQEQAFPAYDLRLPAAVLVMPSWIGSLSLLTMLLVSSTLEARMRASLRRTKGELQKRSATDALTDLPNRMMFEGALADAVRHADETGRRVMEFHESRFADSRSPVHLAAGA
ncbi:MAG: GGDEF domain-containing protein [Proteobacteria bacterium]|nr:GGDEF domain-containing protein [Pseudomonadota bacterium]